MVESTQPLLFRVKSKEEGMVAFQTEDYVSLDLFDKR